METSAETAPRADVTPSETVPGLLRDLTARYAALPAIVDGSQCATFRDLDDHSTLAARALLDAGITKGARIGILMPNGPDYLVALFAAMRIGAVAVLINTLSRPPELAHLLRTADVQILLAAIAF